MRESIIKFLKCGHNKVEINSLGSKYIFKLVPSEINNLMTWFLVNFPKPSDFFWQSNIMKSYGKLFGFLELTKDTHHDEVFINKNSVVIIRNNQWLHDYDELLAIAREEGYQH